MRRVCDFPDILYVNMGDWIWCGSYWREMKRSDMCVPALLRHGTVIWLRMSGPQTGQDFKWEISSSRFHHWHCLRFENMLGRHRVCQRLHTCRQMQHLCLDICDKIGHSSSCPRVWTTEKDGIRNHSFIHFPLLVGGYGAEALVEPGNCTMYQIYNEKCW